ncbi:MAG: histidine--tRNA ligase [Sedimentisphaerales bacterium]|nr:histidine--tRNA ligase [Sedimentisphaerales bacterium]
MKIPPVKGTRDFYPPQMAVRNWIIDGWKRVSRRNGFEEYDGPIFEYLKMYQVKSGDEIVEQLFNMTDRGGRDLAIRPEITPTLARMVNQQINSLARPIKWFSVPRLCRAERPQKGRLREFFQWNIDIIGVDSVLADAEVIFATVDFLREVGLGPSDVKVKISSRKLLGVFLSGIGVGQEKLDGIYAVLDKKGKLPADTFEELLKEQVPDKDAAGKILDFMRVDSIPEVEKLIEADSNERIAWNEVKNVLAYLEMMGVGEYCVYDPSIVRGLAYYTGIVFEVHDIVGELRAICGGGRYDNLLKDFGGPMVSATGMGMGDCVLEILLREKSLLGDSISTREIEYFVAFADNVFGSHVYRLAGELRRRGFSASFSYKPESGLSKQLKEASAQNAKKCVIIGQEFLEGRKLVIKDMGTSEQEVVGYDDFLVSLERGG